MKKKDLYAQYREQYPIYPEPKSDFREIVEAEARHAIKWMEARRPVLSKEEAIRLLSEYVFFVARGRFDRSLPLEKKIFAVLTGEYQNEEEGQNPTPTCLQASNK